MTPGPLETLISGPTRSTRAFSVPLGILLHLALIGFVSAMMIAVFFGVGFYLLRHPTPPATLDFALLEESEIITNAGVPAPTQSTLQHTQSSELDAAADREVEPAQSTALATTLIASALPAPAADVPDGRGGEVAAPPADAGFAEVVKGAATLVKDATTWVVGDQTVRLFGIRPGPPNLLASLSKLENWVRAKGSVDCRRQERSRQYRCFTAAGEDIAEAALLAGLGRIGDHTNATYRGAEAQARRQGKGSWGKP